MSKGDDTESRCDVIVAKFLVVFFSVLAVWIEINR